MNGTCNQSAQDLLMFLHGALPLSQSFKVRMHLFVCPACRAKVASMSSVSQRVARALRNPTSMAPVGAIRPWKFRISSGPAALTVATLIILVGGGYLGISAFTHHADPANDEIKGCQLKRGGTTDDQAAVEKKVLGVTDSNTTTPPPTRPTMVSGCAKGISSARNQ